jgi:lipid-binding SYLF domain-containing protein
MKLWAKWMCVFLFLTCLTAASGGSFNPFKRKHKRSGEENCRLVIQKMQKVDSELEKILATAFAYAVFPEIGKAGIGIGGAAGNGRVYRQGGFIGTTTMAQVSFGFQLGGQTYSEIILFQDQRTLEKFQKGQFELGANVSAVIVDVGAAKKAGFKDGTIVFVMPKKGLMYEAALTGQKFTYKAAK